MYIHEPHQKPLTENTKALAYAQQKKRTHRNTHTHGRDKIGLQIRLSLTKRQARTECTYASPPPDRSYRAFINVNRISSTSRLRQYTAGGAAADVAELSG